ncbi:hypothetical protein NDU88_005963 [Pleurodeles waltl]|uniref:Uncharacterized protein n=1 Tax=Pleurodeles waltl TaxID=8319 RepID=A0AAV7QKK8_PLEWA|nr:hypothetical protein NDU88_005963 [Pleurodeles waltl]
MVSSPTQDHTTGGVREGEEVITPLMEMRWTGRRGEVTREVEKGREGSEETELNKARRINRYRVQDNATRPRKLRHDVTHKKPLPGTHLSLADRPRAPKRPALTAFGSRPHAANTALQGADTRLLAPPNRRNRARLHASAPGVQCHALRKRSHKQNGRRLQALPVKKKKTQVTNHVNSKEKYQPAGAPPHTEALVHKLASRMHTEEMSAPPLPELQKQSKQTNVTEK